MTVFIGKDALHGLAGRRFDCIPADADAPFGTVDVLPLDRAALAAQILDIRLLDI